MISLKQYRKHWARSNKLIATLGLTLSAIGFFDASYLTIIHYLGQTPSCSLLHGCAVVTTSVYSQIFGIPVALLGVVFYISMFFLLFSFLETRNLLYLQLSSLLSIFGLLASVWFVFAMSVLINAYCQYCILSAITSTSLFALLFPITKNAVNIKPWQKLGLQK